MPGVGGIDRRPPAVHIEEERQEVKQVKRIVIRLPRHVKRRLEREVRKTKDAEFRDRCRVVLLYNEGHRCNAIAGMLGRAPATVVRVANRFMAEGEEGLQDRRKENGVAKVDADSLEALLQLLGKCPQDYGYLRTTWTQELLAIVLERMTRVCVSPRTIGRMLNNLNARWGRARPTVKSTMPEPLKKRRLRRIEKLLEKLPRDEVAFFVDEVDIHLNPKIGPDWMLRGQQKEVLTPGVNKKRYIAGALNAATGEVIYVVAEKKNTDIFLRLLVKLKAAHPEAKKIHLVLDNYSIHSSTNVQTARRGFAKKFRFHFLPPYSPEHNRIEKLWKQLHANVTRNHRRKTIEALMHDVEQFLKVASPFPGSQPSTAKLPAQSPRRKAS